MPDVIRAGGFPTAGNPWLANPWRGGRPFWAGWQAAGWNGVAAVAVGLLLVAYRLLYAWLRADGVAGPVAVRLTLLFVGLPGVSRHRPNLVLLAVSLAWLHLALTGRPSGASGGGDPVRSGR